MKNTYKSAILVIGIMLAGLHGLGQAPEGISYQAIARDNSGNPIVDSPIGVKISILQGSSGGTAVYRETHQANSNQYGLLNLSIGMGTALYGNFSQINWGLDEYFTEIAVDISGGTNYQVIGTTQLLSVPFALYAKNVQNVNDADADPENEIQCFSVSEQGDTLYISGCNYVIVPGISEANGGGTPGGTVTDFDGNVYETVQIGLQVWIKTCLRSLHYANGNSITGVYVYDDNNSYAEAYGRLYTWDAIMNGTGSSNGNPSGVQGVCPTGWHLPSKAEFEELISFIGGAVGAGGKMKETGTNHWDPPNTAATNEFGFTARGAGERSLTGTYQYIKMQNEIWTSTEYNTSSAYDLTLYNNQGGANMHSDNKDTGFSVRCVKD